MNGSDDRLPPRSRERRHFLLGMGAAAGGALAAPAALAATQANAQTQDRAGNAGTQHHVTDAPTGDASTEGRWPFYGDFQQGIITPRPAAGMIAAFDVIAKTPKDLEGLFRMLTERLAFLTQGGRPPDLDPKLPPADSGILGPVVAPDNLTATVSVGASLFDSRDWLKPLKPRHLQRMTRFRNDALDAGICHGDIAVQFCANRPDTNIHALRDVMKMMPDKLVLRWKQEGSVPVIPPRPDGRVESARNFLGFRDGSANPDAGDRALMQRILWIDGARGEPAWAERGTYQAIRIIRNFVERWDRTPLGEQERIMGRRKSSGAPFTGTTEFDAPHYAGDPHGTVTALDAHIRLANPRTTGSEKNLILRRPFNYSNGVTKSGQLEQGLLFICYQADLEAGFITVQRRLDGEPLEEYLKPIGGGYFFVLPGAREPGDYLGRTLVEAVRAGNASPT
ncbi:iron uptake transporter deferrochelatase/peroxidase subunit [Chelatococcus asaccharovorans]|uniref:Deferrochelatase n=1 Tax=Chelatococcus asaccharovorans TaxID=28210 RepID=A0A2V3TSS9_9HYPH|nr:iron uptake transporter deferrochelatase/peroxidase subunit [Chelatococcus asaccharovorans]MBS7704967.1 deferrochelatase/peroxidase EfeB [Chelatococcus asaccharovorans]PXW51881.1 deferrochelatase/peroxidase EfeB [Chelatococcus asaccharovorans]CAH1651552.1 heme-containing peroxidase/deferrochelatase [Chelatococcus asaccharovorans]CAH1686589.1 heme-containing peroxidase/deferrochelatase [Chelatococcus asaccharovorans]